MRALSYLSIGVGMMFLLALVAPTITPAYSEFTKAYRDLDGDGTADMQYQITDGKVGVVLIRLDEDTSKWDMFVQDLDLDGQADIIQIRLDANSGAIIHVQGKVDMPPPPGKVIRELVNVDGDPQPDGLIVDWKKGQPAEFATFDSNNDGMQDFVDIIRTNDGSGPTDKIYLENTGGSPNYDRIVVQADGVTKIKSLTEAQKAALPPYFISQTKQ